MIAIAILAILAAVGIVALTGIHGLMRESDYRWALRNAHSQLAELERAPIASLPPQLVHGTGWVQLAHTDLVRGSVRVLQPEGVRVAAVDEAAGRVRLSSGQSALVDYAYYVPDRNEAHTVPANGQIELFNAPVRRLQAVRILHGDSTTALPVSQVDVKGGVLTLPTSARGHVVEVDYLGGRTVNRVSGQTMSANLKLGPGPNRWMTIAEDYGQAERRMHLELLRVAP